MALAINDFENNEDTGRERLSRVIGVAAALAHELAPVSVH